MTATSLTELDSRLLLRVGTHSTDTRLDAARRTDIINEALAQVSLEENWPWQFVSAPLALVVDQGEYPVPAGWIQTEALSYGDLGYNIKLVPFKQIRDYADTYKARPRIFTVRNGTIYLRPIPNVVKTVTHDYYRSEPILVAGLDIPLIPREYATGVVEWATHLACLAIKENSRALEARKEYDLWLARTKDNISETQGPLLPYIRPGSFV